MPHVKFFKKFASRETFDFLIGSLRCQDADLEQLIIDAGALVNESYEAIRNTCVLLIDAGVFSDTCGKLSLSNKEAIEESYELIRAYLLARFFSDGLAKSAKSHPEISIYIDSHFLPHSHSTFPHVAYTVGLFGLPVQSRFWPVMPCYNGLLLTGLKKHLSQPGPKKLSPEGLAKMLEAQAEAGLKAELWFFQKEKIRLAAHPLVDCIRHVSIEDVGAGYDIFSFNSLESLSLDRYIEIKSFVGKPTFYISENELSMAKELGKNYKLVIIDRNKINQPDYSPLELIDPYPLLLSQDRPKWIDVKASNLFVSLGFDN